MLELDENFPDSLSPISTLYCIYISIPFTICSVYKFYSLPGWIDVNKFCSESLQFAIQEVPTPQGNYTGTPVEESTAQYLCATQLHNSVI